ncbi:hypothetical protein GLOIN_2v1798071 [Rhizophagus irregularis DAOM 181602=DAOM 197198]|uniref:C2H2-type domain-containing protein n=2 Tax=Rhizophagus irregularis TaxID=588596 RepID=A0A015L8Q9_RHIIW|nr:hypothetical protein RirG_036430 [Rhizophagus irregularis DAOM 197198w]GBC37985.1 hypothetical protein GLOIN_2v1798071 [Rhizophagus irregularis DAOM 181602=DAOM 197198]
MSQKRKSSSTVTTKKSSRTVSRTKKDSIVGDLDFEDLDFQYCYSVKELELINNYLRVNPNFEIINRKLISISYTPIAIEAVVHEIARQLGNWNVETNKDGLGIVTTSNGGYDFRDTNLQKIQAPDVAFTPEDTYLSLDEKQLWSFEGQPFTPIFIVKVANIKNSEVEKEVNNKIKKDYFAHGTSVKLGWLIDPIDRNIWVYKRDKNGSPYRRRQPWEDLDAGDILPDFTLELEMINDIIDKDSASDDDKEEEEEDDDDDEGKKRRKRIDDDDDEGKKRRKKVKKNEAECPYCDLEINTASKMAKHIKKMHVK